MLKAVKLEGENGEGRKWHRKEWNEFGKIQNEVHLYKLVDLKRKFFNIKTSIFSSL